MKPISAVDLALNAYADRELRRIPTNLQLHPGDPAMRPDPETRARVGRVEYCPGDWESIASKDALSRPYHEAESLRPLSERGMCSTEADACDVDRVIQAQDRPPLVKAMVLWLHPTMGLMDDGADRDPGMFVFTDRYEVRYDEYLFTRTSSPKRTPETLKRGCRLVWKWFRQDLWQVFGKVDR